MHHAGFLINIDDMPPWLYGFSYMAFAKYALELLVTNEFSDQYFDCARMAAPNCIETGEQVIRNLSYEKAEWRNIAILGTFMMLTLLLSILCLKRGARGKIQITVQSHGFLSDEKKQFELQESPEAKETLAPVVVAHDMVYLPPECDDEGSIVHPPENFDKVANPTAQSNEATDKRKEDFVETANPIAQLEGIAELEIGVASHSS